MKLILITFLFTLLTVLLPGSEARAAISRTLDDIPLGTPISDFIDQYENREITNTFTLSRGDRIFAVKGNGKEVDFIWCSFYNGKLYKIELFYSLEFSRSVSWGALVRRGVMENGQGRIVESTHGPVATWGDEHSSLKMETRIGKKKESRFVVSLLDNALYLDRGETCASDRHEA